MKNKLDKIKQEYKNRYNLSQDEIENNLIFAKTKDEKIVVGMPFFNQSQDNSFYLFDGEKYMDLYNEPIAQIKFFLDKDNKSAYIRRLEFVNNNYKGKGYATMLMKCFEKYCQKNNIFSLEGEFIPLHNESPEKVRKYYKRNGFSFKKVNGQEYISKILQDEKNLSI